MKALHLIQYKNTLDMLHTIKILMLLLFITNIASLQAQTGTASASATFTDPPVTNVKTNEVLTYNIGIDAIIPEFVINGNGYDIGFGEIKLQIHEVDVVDVANMNDTSNQILMTESNLKQFIEGDNQLAFNMKAPKNETALLPNNRKYRVRLTNTGIGKVSTTLNAFELVVSNTTLSNEEIVKNNLNIYPNPTSDMVYISLPIKKVTLHSLMGKVVLKTTSSSFSTRTLSPGIYIATIETENNKILKHKILKE